MKLFSKILTLVLVLATTTTLYINKGYEIAGATPTKHIYAGSADGDLIGNVKGSGSGASLYSVHNDHLTGSNVISNSTGSTEELTDYYPYGKIRLDQATSTFKESRKYTGHTYDTDTDLTYAKARYYDGKIGRFQSQDPMFQAIGGNLSKYDRTQEQLLSNPQELNSYSYVTNNPLKYKDPTGETRTQAAMGSVNATLEFIGNTVGGTVMSVFHPIQTIQNLPQIPGAIAQQVSDIKNGITPGDDTRMGYSLTSGLLLLGIVLAPEASGFGKTVSLPRFIANTTVDDYGRLIKGTVDLKPTLDRISKGERLSQFRNDGIEFRNDPINGNLLLPEKPRGYYKEYVHQTPGINNRQGPQRVIVGNGGETYYSPDHYNSVIHLNQ